MAIESTIAIFAYNHLLRSGASINAYPIYPENPLENILIDNMALPVIAQGTSITIAVDLGIARPINGICIPSSNMTVHALGRLRISNNADLISNTPNRVPIRELYYDDQKSLGHTTCAKDLTVSLGEQEISVANNVSFSKGALVLIEHATDSSCYMIGNVKISYDSGKFTLDVTEFFGSPPSSNNWIVRRLRGTVNIFPQTQDLGSGLFGEIEWGGRSELAKPPFIKILDSTITARYLRLELTDPSNLDDLIIPYFWVGSCWQPSRNIWKGYQIKFSSTSDVRQLIGGGQTTRAGVTYRTIRFTIDMLEEEEAKGQSYYLSQVISRDRNFLVVINPNATTTLAFDSIWGKFTDGGLPTMSHSESILYKIDFEIKETPPIKY